MRAFPRCFLLSTEKQFYLYKPYIHEHELPEWPFLLMDRDEMSKPYRGPSIDASYQVSVHLAEGFQSRRLKCERLTDDGCQVMAKAHVAFGKAS